MRNALKRSYRDRHLICMFGLQTFTSLYRNHVTEVVSKRLSTCIRSTQSMYRINFSLFRVREVIYGNDRKRLYLLYARRGEIAWPNVFPYSLSRKLHASPNMCRFQMHSCMENCAVSRREIVEKYLIYSRNYSIPHRNKEKNELYDADFLVTILKIGVITSLRTRRSSITYSA